jgi:hypothetical protein
MTPTPATPWHHASYENFITHTLPNLLADRVPLESYGVERVDDYHYKVTLSLKANDGSIDLVFDDVPAPDEIGLFSLEGTLGSSGGFRTVVPVPDSFDLTTARIKCVGEQLAEFVEARLGDAPADLAWDQKLAEAWLPVTGWVETFLRTRSTSQFIQSTNWIDRTTHLRRITFIPLAYDENGIRQMDRLMPGEVAAGVVKRGLTCPIVMPEGPNMGWIVDIARGAEIRDGRLSRIAGADDQDPTLDLGWSATMIPFIEHSDSARLLMGANMMRQWIAPRNTKGLPSVRTAQTYPDDLVDALNNPPGPTPEPALVQTGTEPDDPDGWAGYNLLTAFMMWGGDTFEDGVALSESGAARMAFPREVHIGDKISTRHGFKGVVSRILPDSEMPSLPDGTVIDAIISPMSLVSRMNYGLLLESVMGLIAHAEGKPAIVPAYQAPSAADIKDRLKKAGLPEDGMENLSVSGKALPQRSTVGYVYWGRLTHLAADKVKANDQRFDETQYGALKGLSAYATITDMLGRAKAAGHEVPDIGDLADTLATAGIGTKRDGETIAFSTNGSSGYELSAPIQHPWNADIQLTSVPTGDGDLFDTVIAADERVKRLKPGAPEPLRHSAVERLTEAVDEYLDDTLSAADLRIDTRTPNSGRAVIVPGPELSLNQIGLPRQLAWDIFAEDVAAELGQDAVANRTKEANEKLESIATSTHLLVHKGVRTTPTSILAVYSVLTDEPAIRIHPMYCALLDVDFDGDQVGVFRPGSDEAIQECAERLTIAGHLRHTPEAIRLLIHRPHEINWGLAHLARTEEGRAQIGEIVGEPIGADYRGRRSYLPLLEQIYRREGDSDEGIARTLSIYDQLMRLGFETCRQTGASISPFLGDGLDLPKLPASDDPELLQIYKEELLATLDQATDPRDDNLGTFNTYRHTGTRGSNAQYILYFGAHGLVAGADGEPVNIRHGYIEGLDIAETIAHCARTRAALAGALREMETLKVDRPMTTVGYGVGVIARARRSDRPGVVFARAAARNEVDPLEDIDARVICGLPLK